MPENDPGTVAHGILPLLAEFACRRCSNQKLKNRAALGGASPSRPSLRNFPVGFLAHAITRPTTCEFDECLYLGLSTDFICGNNAPLSHKITPLLSLDFQRQVPLLDASGVPRYFEEAASFFPCSSA